MIIVYINCKYFTVAHHIHGLFVYAQINSLTKQIAAIPVFDIIVKSDNMCTMFYMQ